MKDLAIIILNQKINERIDFINRQSTQKFDEKIDCISISLSEKQFAVIKKYFKLKQVYVLCRGYEIDNFSFNNWKIQPRYNARMSVYELYCKSNNYIDDFDEREDYIDNLLGEN